MSDNSSEINTGGETNARLAYFVINGSLILVFFSWRIFVFTGALSSFIFWYTFLAAIGFFHLFLKPGEDTSADGIWSSYDGSFSCKPTKYHRPASIEEIVDIIKKVPTNGSIKAVGKGHSLNGIAMTKGEIIILEKFNQVVKLDKSSNVVTVQAGITLKQLHYYLWENGFALPNAPDSQQTVGGAVQVGSYGNSTKYGSFSSLVTELVLIDGSGRVLTLNSSSISEFNAARIGLGALGIVALVTLRVEPAFHVRYVDEPALNLLDEISKAQETKKNVEYLSFRWIPGTTTARKITISKVSSEAPKQSGLAKTILDWAKIEPGKFVSGLLFSLVSIVPSLHEVVIRHVGKLFPPVDTTLASFEAFSSLSLPSHSAVEYAIPQEKAVDCFNDLQRVIRDKKWKLNFFSTISWANRDEEILLSNFDSVDSVIISVGIVGKNIFRKELIGALDDLFKNYSGRPHWGKHHNLKAENFPALYHKFSEFQQIRNKYDPNGIFSNRYLDRNLISQ